MAKPLVSGELWEMLQPLPPPAKHSRFRHPVPPADRRPEGADQHPFRTQERPSPGRLLPKRGAGHGNGLGAYRWVVGRTLAWLHQFRRLRVRCERTDEIHEAFPVHRDVHSSASDAYPLFVRIS